MAKYNLTRDMKAAERKMLSDLFGISQADLTSDVSLTIPKASMQPKPCACGCGDTTLGTWVTGHDGKVKKHLIAVMRGERASHAGWWDELDAVGALYILETAGWTKGINLA